MPVLAISSSQNIAVVKLGCSRKAIVSENGSGFIGWCPRVRERPCGGSCNGKGARSLRSKEIPIRYRFDATDVAINHMS
jgi:hypothetical protein